MSYGYLFVAPPSTTITWPVIVRARSLTRKVRALATSAGSVNR